MKPLNWMFLFLFFMFLFLLLTSMFYFMIFHLKKDIVNYSVNSYLIKWW